MGCASVQTKWRWALQLRPTACRMAQRARGRENARPSSSDDEWRTVQDLSNKSVSLKTLLGDALIMAKNDDFDVFDDFVEVEELDDEQQRK